MEFIKLENVKAHPDEDGMLLVQRKNGFWEEYDPTWDITIHCTSEADMNKTFADMKEGLELLKGYKTGKVGHVRRGRWMIEGRILCCSKCDWNVLEEQNYCPNCGAKMR